MQSSFFGPLKYSILPLQLTKDDLLKANALIEAGTFLAILMGTIIGGLIITISHGILWLTAIVFSAAIIGFCSSLGSQEFL